MMTHNTIDQEPTVFLVDDDYAVRDALSRLIRSVGLQVECYESATSFLEMYNEKRPGCLVLDVRMPQMSGVELQELLSKRALSLPIIFVSAHGDVEVVVKAMKLGAAEFLQKPVSEEVLLDSIMRCIRRDKEFRDEQSALSIIREHIASLTDREREVMDHFVEGKNTKRVAMELNISPKTVEFHRANILEKTGMDSMVNLVRQVMRLRFADMQSSNDSVSR